AEVVALGRPMLWGLNQGGAAGVQLVYEHLATELKIVMQLTGAHTVAELQRAKIINAKF
ncbi:MAG: alpha-hydroxy-acid oxidizing protein, partial [Weissella cibaria]